MQRLPRASLLGSASLLGLLTCATAQSTPDFHGENDTGSVSLTFDHPEVGQLFVFGQITVDPVPPSGVSDEHTEFLLSYYPQLVAQSFSATDYQQSINALGWFESGSSWPYSSVPVVQIEGSAAEHNVEPVVLQHALRHMIETTDGIAKQSQPFANIGRIDWMSDPSYAPSGGGSTPWSQLGADDPVMRWWKCSNPANTNSASLSQDELIMELLANYVRALSGEMDSEAIDWDHAVVSNVMLFADVVSIDMTLSAGILIPPVPPSTEPHIKLKRTIKVRRHYAPDPDPESLAPTFRYELQRGPDDPKAYLGREGGSFDVRLATPKAPAFFTDLVEAWVPPRAGTLPLKLPAAQFLLDDNQQVFAIRFQLPAASEPETARARNGLSLLMMTGYPLLVDTNVSWTDQLFELWVLPQNP